MNWIIRILRKYIIAYVCIYACYLNKYLRWIKNSFFRFHKVKKRLTFSIDKSLLYYSPVTNGSNAICLARLIALVNLR